MFLAFFVFSYLLKYKDFNHHCQHYINVAKNKIIQFHDILFETFFFNMTHKECFLKRNPTGMTTHPKLRVSTLSFGCFEKL